MPLEPMADFFDARADGYDAHMLENVEGCRAGYPELARWLPDNTRDVLDLGCGTGLELDALYARFPQARVTGYDLSSRMLKACEARFAAYLPTLRQQNYLTAVWPEASFDAAISFESLHHFTEDEKRSLYGRVRRALRPGGRFVLGDYMVQTDAEERALRAEYERLRAAENACGLVHFDTPFTIAHECAVLRAAGFADAQAVWREGNTTLIVAK